MWLRDEVLYPRFLRSLLWTTVLQYILINSCLLFFKIISWHPFSSISDWFLGIFHWRSILHLGILSAFMVAFGILNMQSISVEKHISETRFKKILRALSLNCLQHVICTTILGGLAAYSYDCLFHNFRDKSSFIYWLSSASDLEQSFIIGHGCFTGFMFSLKYFICNMYLVKFQEAKVHSIKYQMYDLLKESFFCVVKAIVWYYGVYILAWSLLKILSFSDYDSLYRGNDNILSFIKVSIICIVSGVVISYMWSLYILVFNVFATETYKFPITVPIRGDKKLTLSCALGSKEFGYLKYLAALDLRLLSQLDSKRREQIFAISHPGGHPHEWKAISGVCIALLKEFVDKLNEYSFATASAVELKTKPSKYLKEKIILNGVTKKPEHVSLFQKTTYYLRKKTAVSYFFDELPNVKLMKLFAPSQPFIWIIDALGYLVAISFNEDKYGVVQQTLSEIICLLLDIKMAEEKMPVGLVGIQTYVKDPQGRYDHMNQRQVLKTSVNNALCRIACTFHQNINGIHLPVEYKQYFERYLDQKN